ncbi:hypothetical protein [Ralstonia mannitolilytica]|nr:hypothetical protein [Ralstonia mannitolilytica]MBU9578402.1 hypothetical protein [Ralstonia mannitolilytica]CAJ0733911.1 hypothetical protein R76706_03380 [Ralstonia mannitolilytica]CAJ0794762.1 hypothetical protein R77555_02678 [Ralstonia mannitolilytica]
MGLLPKFLPEHQFSEQHRIGIDAAPGCVLDAERIAEAPDVRPTRPE